MRIFVLLATATLALARSPSLTPRAVETGEFDAESLARLETLNQVNVSDPAIAASIVSNELTLGGCRDVIFVFARGTSEQGNMGTLVGPPLSGGLKSIYGDSRVATEGVNYAAIPAPNFLPGGTDGPSIAAMSSILLGAAMNCPASKVVVGGYSQGAAVAHRSIESLPPVAKNQIVGVLTVGDTQKTQDGSRIFNFPPDRVSFLCNPGDVICDGQLVVLAPHLDYTRRAGEGVGFLASKIGIL
ncbi:cutinase [Verticillium dahliae VdLs.17]|uniref:Cutinase n=1 Tax=Verticillium dahliae (strain VdLs.17 / ATCC MYA-4575 / FGSC 10137) TaxID=498257 RepID=G2WTY6_VERDV|nr:cutinase [Verticillium dahliae VdLs.17]EGY17577.1 cutinase [Verticillium dahliae VdLs.17]KAH6690957.1 cutinase [Verticillium dahliae]